MGSKHTDIQKLNGRFNFGYPFFLNNSETNIFINSLILRNSIKLFLPNDSNESNF